ncbi:PcfJ domain-containing protein [Flavobacterium plurextorum]|uniref:PcfJ domain-containing protein n=1 Tax=Flavobacterium TaxID=237 RepID=UPI00214D567B|nr:MULTISPECIES: PcfJ domain-containing protein [Flavobacterium]UUW08287.1 PcfJ domain-containing protein [Flavobacterium plurextorum]
MTPKTIIEKQITELSSTLKPITSQMQSWAEKNIFLKWAVLSWGKFHCLQCTHSWKPDSESQSCKNYINCTACQGRLKMHQYNQVHFREIEYFAVTDTCQGYQVVRIICSHKNMKKNVLPDYSHSEVMQHWISSKGEVRTISRSTNVFSQAYDAWKYYSPLEIRPKSFQSTPKYRINPYKVYPNLNVIPLLKRNGFKTSTCGIAPQILFTALLKDPIAETLLKSAQNSLLKHYLTSHQQHLRENWQAVKICLKHRYQIQDIKIWEDYIALLRWFKKDISSPALVCPENLDEAHDRLVAKKREIQRRKYLAQMRAEIQKAEPIYENDKKQFFGLSFTDNDLTVKVLNRVQDFLEEGDTLHHCVFTNEYYKKKDSLILSAQIENRPVETIEISLSRMEIIQCRGLRNKATKHHSRILRIIRRNLPEIAKRLKKQKKKTASA